MDEMEKNICQRADEQTPRPLVISDKPSDKQSVSASRQMLKKILQTVVRWQPHSWFAHIKYFQASLHSSIIMCKCTQNISCIVLTIFQVFWVTWSHRAARGKHLPNKSKHGQLLYLKIKWDRHEETRCQCYNGWAPSHHLDNGIIVYRKYSVHPSCTKWLRTPRRQKKRGEILA